MNPIAATDIRYIKLARGGKWADISLDRGEIHFGYSKVPHRLGLALDFEGIKEFCTNDGSEPGRATGIARQVIDFYGLGPDCLWITFARDHLWWTFAEPNVQWLGPSETREHGERMRKSIGGWKNTDLYGKPLTIRSLSTALTCVANYRQTICNVGEDDYLLRRINGIETPLVQAANQARNTFVDVIWEALKALSWSDFETLIDIVFVRSGWHRVSALGGSQKDIDLELSNPATGQRVAVQIKSRAGQKVLNDYVDRVSEYRIYDRFYFVCHSPKGTLEPRADAANVEVWAGRDLATRILKLGLHDWVFERIA